MGPCTLASTTAMLTAEKIAIKDDAARVPPVDAIEGALLSFTDVNGISWTRHYDGTLQRGATLPGLSPQLRWASATFTPSDGCS